MDMSDAKWDDPEPMEKTVLFVMIEGRKFVPEVETDEDWMHRVYPHHAWTPDDGMTYERFCQTARAEWEATHAELKAELALAHKVLDTAEESDWCQIEGRMDILVDTDAWVNWLAAKEKP